MRVDTGIPMNDWKDHWTTTYLIVGRESLTLVDAGAPASEASLREGLEVVSKFYGESITLADIDHVVITHAHFDHFGGLQFLIPNSRAELWIHEWDAHTVADYPQEMKMGRVRIQRFLVQSGMPPDQIAGFMKMHGRWKQEFPGYPVAHAFQDGDRIVEDFEVIHTPGHCPGLSCIRIGDVLLMGDHVLNNVSPHQFPKIYTSGSGLLNYFNSLLKISAKSENIRLGLPSHYGDVLNVEARAMEIMGEHNQRIADIVKDLDRPKSLYEISTDYYQFRRGREIRGYDSLLALEEIGAHLEFMEETLGIVQASSPDAFRDDSDEIVGDSVHHTATWEGGALNDLSRLKGGVVQLRFLMNRAKLYSFWFIDGGEPSPSPAQRVVRSVFPFVGGIGIHNSKMSDAARRHHL